MTPTPLPNPHDVRETLQMLLGRDVDLATGADQVVAQSAAGAVVGVFTTGPQKKLAALWVSDLPLSAYLGAALGLVPARTATDAIESGLTPLLAENLHEAINVMGSLLNTHGAPHVVLDQVYLPRETLPRDVAGYVNAFVPRHDLTVTVAGYGTGSLSILTI